jgi:hypothetical protein
VLGIISEAKVQYISTVDHSTVTPCMILGWLKRAVDEAVIKVYPYRPLIHHGRIDFLAEANPETGRTETAWRQKTISTPHEGYDAEEVGMIIGPHIFDYDAGQQKSHKARLLLQTFHLL